MIEESSVSTLIHVHEKIPTITAPILGSIGPLTFATSTLTIILLTLLFIVLCDFVSRSSIIPTKFQNLLELFYEKVVSFIASIVGDVSSAKRIVPYVGSVLIYLLVSNLLFIIPFVSSFYITKGGEDIQLFRGNTTDFNTAFGLALASIVIMQIVGIREQGLANYLGRFIRIKGIITGFKKNLEEGVLAIIFFFVGLIEIISEFAKILSLSLRLFGNMFAHEVLAVILLGAFSFIVPVVWMGLGLLVGVIQSVVFVALITVYYSMVFNKEPKSDTSNK